MSISASSITSALDKPDFRTGDFINQIFPNEASLVAIDPFLHRLQNKIRQVDAEILLAIRQQSSCGSKAKEDLASAMTAIQELSGKMREIKDKSEKSEVMVQEICRDIKKLDFAKKHITTTITALNRLAMLVLAVDRLQVLSNNRQYKEAAGQLEAVSQLMSHFEGYKEHPKISELRDKYETLKAMLKNHVFSDFASLSNLGSSRDASSSSSPSSPLDSSLFLQQLSDSCLVVDGMEEGVREELIRTVCGKEVQTYQHIFQGTDVARLEKAERRFAWIRRQLKMNEELFKIFPQHWKVPFLLCQQFCKITKAQLSEVLANAKEKTDVAVLLQAVERTLEFEEELTFKFKDSISDSPSREEDGANDPPPSSSSSTYPNSSSFSSSSSFTFKGLISSVFEAHMGPYVELEEKTLMEALDKLVAEETWDVEEGNQTHILSSSTQMFLAIRKSCNRCCQLTRNLTLFNLLRVFQRVLTSYALRLNSKLPRPPNESSSLTLFKFTEREEKTVCFIINTAEYCHQTISQLSESIQNRIDASFKEKIDMTKEQDEFSSVLSRGLSVLVLGLETCLDAELEKMTRANWLGMESVGDQSDYVSSISSILANSVPLISSLLSPFYFEFFLDKMAASFAPRFHVSIYKCKRLSGTGAQQLLLDTHALKTALLEVPALGGQSPSQAFSKFVNRELGKSEALLKVILSPLENVVSTFRTLIPEGSSAEFQRILDLKGVKKHDQQALIDQLIRASPLPPPSLPSFSPLRPSSPTSLSPAPFPSSLSASSSLAPSSSLSAAPGSALSAVAAGAVAAGSSMLITSAGAMAAGAVAVANNREAMIARAANVIGRAGQGISAQSAVAAAAVSQTQGALKRIFQLAENTTMKK